MNTEEWITLTEDILTEDGMFDKGDYGLTSRYGDGGIYTKFFCGTVLSDLFLYDDEYISYQPTHAELLDWMLKVMKG